MHYQVMDYIPPAIGLPFAAILWFAILVIWFRKPVVDKVIDFFAHRRHVRRMRRSSRSVSPVEAYLLKDIELTRKSMAYAKNNKHEFVTR